MKVKELIKRLNELDSELNVKIMNENGDLVDVAGVAECDDETEVTICDIYLLDAFAE